MHTFCVFEFTHIFNGPFRSIYKYILLCSRLLPHVAIFCQCAFVCVCQPLFLLFSPSPPSPHTWVFACCEKTIRRSEKYFCFGIMCSSLQFCEQSHSQFPKALTAYFTLTVIFYLFYLRSFAFLRFRSLRLKFKWQDEYDICIPTHIFDFVHIQKFIRVKNKHSYIQHRTKKQVEDTSHRIRISAMFKDSQLYITCI